LCGGIDEPTSQIAAQTAPRQAAARPGGPAGEAKPPVQSQDVLVLVNDEPITAYEI
jgi:hypothetical protein